MKHAMVLAFAAAVLSGASHAAESIVGKWRFPSETCDMPINVGALSLKSEDVNCAFTSVKRIGNQVTWQGHCDDAEGTSAETVVATLKASRLTVRYVKGGNVLPDLVRCK